MKTKKDDKLYCGVDESKIKSANPILNEEVLKYHHLYITERTEIYKRKEIDKLPQPWTTEDVFIDYRFTNTRRELDRESKWLIKNVSEANISLNDKILNSILFRTFNKSETSEIISMPINLENSDIDINYYRNIFIEYNLKNPKYVFFTPAFIVGGIKKANAFTTKPYARSSNVELILEDGTIKDILFKHAREEVANNPKLDIVDWERNTPTRMIHLIKRAISEGILDKINNSNTQQEVYNHLRTIPGFSNFLAYQVFVDLTYIKEFKFSENEYTVSGPGCTAGIELLFDNKDEMTDEEALFWVRDNIESEWDKRGLHVDVDKLFDFLPKEDRILNIMMYENSFCELSKIVKTKRGTGRPRNKYTPTDKIKKEIEEW